MLNQAADPFGIIGQVLDSQFRVDRLVGEGGFSAVYRGHHLGLGEPIAVKCLKLPPSLAPQLVEQFERRFRDESRILYRLSQGNLNIVRSIAGGTWQSPIGLLVPFMVLEWMDGRSLANEFTIRRTVGKQGRPMSEVMKVFASAADGIGYAHAQGVLHRDLNPGNFFFASSPQGQRIKVLDFGVAKILDDSSLNIERNQTVGQLRIFAPAYGAPEQFDDALGKTSAASDVYSFALILMEALRDRPVNDGTHLGEFAQRALDPYTRPTPRALGIDVSDEIEEIFTRATKVRPHERWQNVTELWNALLQAESAASEERHAQAALETPALGMPSPGRSTKTGMAPPARPQVIKSSGTMKQRTDKTLPVNAVRPAVPGASRPPPIPPSAPRVEVAKPKLPTPPQPPVRPATDFGEEATRVGLDAVRSAPPPVLSDQEQDSDEVTRVGAPAADVLRGLADVDNPKASGAVTMTQVSQGNQNNNPRPAAGLPAPPAAGEAQQPGFPQPPAPPAPPRPPQPALAGTLMMAPGQGFGPLPPPPQRAGAPQPPQAPAPPPPPPPPPQQQMQPPPQQQMQPPPQQPPMGYGQPQQQQPPPQQQQPPPPQQQYPAQAHQPPIITRPSYVPEQKKSNTGLIVGIVCGLLLLGGVVAAVIVVGMAPKNPTVPSATVSAPPIAVPSTPPATPEPETTVATPPPAVEDAGAAVAIEIDAGTQAGTTADPGNGNPTNGGQPQPVNNGGGQTWQPPPPAPGPGPAPVAATKDAGPPADPNAFSEGTARSKLAQANGVLVFCKKEGGVTGPGSATVTFAPDGSVTAVAMDAPYAGTPTGDCVAGQFKRQKTSPWQGSPQSVKHSFEVPK